MVPAGGCAGATLAAALLAAMLPRPRTGLAGGGGLAVVVASSGLGEDGAAADPDCASAPWRAARACADERVGKRCLMRGIKEKFIVGSQSELGVFMEALI
jgi:hypothetical protein